VQQDEFYQINLDITVEPTYYKFPPPTNFLSCFHSQLSFMFFLPLIHDLYCHFNAILPSCLVCMKLNPIYVSYLKRFLKCVPTLQFQQFSYGIQNVKCHQNQFMR